MTLTLSNHDLTLYPLTMLKTGFTSLEEEQYVMLPRVMFRASQYTASENLLFWYNISMLTMLVKVMLFFILFDLIVLSR